MSAWFGLVNGWRVLAIVFLAAAAHEAGHCLALFLTGAGWHRLRLGILGAVLEVEWGALSYGKELFCVLAGPGANLLCAAAVRGRWEVLAGANIVLCLFNLLPLRPLDGGRALYLAVCALAGPGAGETAIRLASALSALMLGTALIWIVGQTGGSLWLLPAAAAAYTLSLREWLGK